MNVSLIGFSDYSYLLSASASVHLTAFLSFGQGKEKWDTNNSSTTENTDMPRVRQNKYPEKGQILAKTSVRVMSSVIEKGGFWI